MSKSRKLVEAALGDWVRSTPRFRRPSGRLSPPTTVEEWASLDFGNGPGVVKQITTLPFGHPDREPAKFVHVSTLKPGDYFFAGAVDQGDEIYTISGAYVVTPRGRIRRWR